MRIEQKIKELGIDLPEAPKPAAIYIPVKQVGNTLYITGQIPFVNGKLAYTGKVGGERTLEEAQEAAKIVTINILAAVKEHIGDLDKVVNVVKLQGLVNSEADFNQPHIVINAASELLFNIFGDAGRHARTTFCVSGLPLGATVEIEGIFEVEAD